MIVLSVDKFRNTPSFDKLFDYYYDNIHWSKSDIKPSSTFREWLSDEYCADYDYINQIVYFKDPKKYTYFALRWL